MVSKLKVVCFGGGNGVPKAVLQELKNYNNIDITSVTSMVDNGGSAGVLQKELNVLPPGDIRRHILALSDAEDWKKELWKLRFANDIEFEGGHKGHSFANVFIGGLESSLHDYKKVFDILHDFMKVKGRVLPAVLENATLYAELENGQIIEGEKEVDTSENHDNNLKIKRVFLKPLVDANPDVIEAVEKADVVIIGPGDLYSSLIPCFLSRGMKEAIQKSKAKKIFICPAMTKLGETNNFTVKDFEKEVEKYLGCKLDHLVYNNVFEQNEDRIRKYKIEEPLIMDFVKFDESVSEPKFVGVNLLPDEGGLVYNSKKLVALLVNLIKK